MRQTRLALLAAVLLCGGGGGASAADQLRLLNWADYIDLAVLDRFRAETGVEVILETYHEAQFAEVRLLAENDEIDVAVMSNEFIARLREEEVIAPIRTERLGRLDELDPMLSRDTSGRRGERYAVPYLWGTVGIGYEANAVAARMPDAPVASWSMAFDPEIVARFADCGVVVIDSPEEVVSAALAWLGLDPLSARAEDLDAAFAAIAQVAPLWRVVSNESPSDLSLGTACVSLGWNGDVLWAADGALEGLDVRFALPVEGAPIWVDSFVIPRDAPNAEAAHAFLDFMTRPDILALCTNYTWTANANPEADPLVEPEVREDEGVYPSPEARRALYRLGSRSTEEIESLRRRWRLAKLAQS